MSETESISSTLSTKVTVIVFWGLVVIGLVFAGLFLHDKEVSTRTQRELISDSIAFRLQELDRGEERVSTARMENLFQRLRRTYPDARFELWRNGEEIVRVGAELQAPLQTLRRQLRMTGDGGKVMETELRIRFPSLDTVVHQGRSSLLLGLGALLLFFGVVLKVLLERILTRPMARMAETARAISAGDIYSRFDETRNDEFGYLGSFVNEAIRRLIESENDARRSRELAEVTLHSIADAVVTTDELSRITYMNPVAQKLTGSDLASVQGSAVEEVIRLANEQTGVLIGNPVKQCIENNEVVDLQQNCVLLRKDGMSMPIDPAVAPIRDNDRKVRGTVMVMHDMSEARSLQHELSYQASHDPLTGLYNRREFDREIQYLLERSARDGHEHTLCYLDLDQFKVVNDTCGHRAGDQLLQKLTARLQAGLRKADVMARLGGDEFGLLLYHCPVAVAYEVAEKIRQTINDFRFVWDGQSFQVGVSIGLAPLEAGSSGVSEVLAAADMACYAAKEDGRNRIHIYRPDDEELHRRRAEMSMVSAVRKALTEDSFELFAQPIVPIAARNGLPHYEILIRMKDEQGGYVPPGAFLPALERYQLMAALDRWVVKHAVDFMQEQLQRGNRLCLSVNLSGQSINEDSFLDYLVEQIGRLGEASSLCCFEITETAAVNNMDRAFRLINALKSHGCHFALDDFGTGVSSFSYLKSLAVDFVKIDGAFIRNAHENPVDQAMVKAIVEVANVMGIRTIAEFVENVSLHEMLNDLGVDYGQGYWYGAPKSVNVLFAEQPPPLKVIND